MPGATVHSVTTLARGRHSHPRGGACLVELASTLPGGPWTDHPAGIAPVLAELARLVNDGTSDGGRVLLTPLVPWLFTHSPSDREQTAAALATLARHAAQRWADVATAERMARAATMLGRDPGATRWARWDRAARHRAAIRAVRLAVRALAGSTRVDEELRTLLIDAVNLTRRLDGLPPLSTAWTHRNSYCGPLPVRAESRAPDGAESAYHHCTALLDDWPPLLRQAWGVRTGELRRLQNGLSSTADGGGGVLSSTAPRP